VAYGSYNPRLEGAPKPHRYRPICALPSGPLHFGSLVAALGSFLNVKSKGGHWLVRIEDIDPLREPAGAATQILNALEHFGLSADAPVLYQSTRMDVYRATLEQLIQSGHAFPCFCTRSQLAGLPHRGRCASKSRNQPSWRLAVADIEIDFVDRVYGHYSQSVGHLVGDFVLWRSDNLPSYQLACVIDDAFSGVTEIVRGADLLEATPRQIYLQRLLDFPEPKYAHLPLVLGADGQKLSKQNLAPEIDSKNVLTLLRLANAFLGQIPSAKAQAALDPAVWLRESVIDWQIERVRAHELTSS